MHHAMMTAMAKSKEAYGKDYAFGGGDGVHASASGHLAMAYAFLKAMGCDGNIGTITLDLPSEQADATEGHKILSVKGGCVEIESTRYPYCFDPDPNPIPSKPTHASILPYLPFNEDLNRYLLVVHGLKSPRAKVTWGTQSKVFSAAALAKGINLAAEYLDNPFSLQFHKVEEMVQAQQGMEISLVNDLLHNIPRLKSQDSSQAHELEQIAQDGMAQDRKMSDLPGGRVKPVRHTLKVEAIE